MDKATYEQLDRMEIKIDLIAEKLGAYQEEKEDEATEGKPRIRRKED